MKHYCHDTYNGQVIMRAEGDAVHTLCTLIIPLGGDEKQVKALAEHLVAYLNGQPGTSPALELRAAWTEWQNVEYRARISRLEAEIKELRQWV